MRAAGEARTGSFECAILLARRCYCRIAQLEPKLAHVRPSFRLWLSTQGNLLTDTVGRRVRTS